MAGATGNLGSRVVRELQGRGKRIRALVREGTDPSRLETQGVEISRGDLLDPASLDRALDGVSTLITTATGFMRRRKGDSLAVDDLGNRNLVDAAREAKIGCFVFTSVLTCDRALSVPHFWKKKLIEDYIEASGVPFVALRPGVLIGAVEGWDLWSGDLRKGRMTALGSADGRLTYVHVDDVARCLALAVDEPRALGKRIDLGMDRPISMREAAAIFTGPLGRPIKVRSLPWIVVGNALRVAGRFDDRLGDIRAMLDYYFTGVFVADTSVQAQWFGPVPTVEDTFRRYLNQLGLLTAPHG
ncbi:MAG: SDR family oxidoreductase [Betaproteobacteria bacterium]|nr:SDR family oxidoreductase [Betaproteobacteria bacterium]